jgi:hypothetical protein
VPYGLDWNDSTTKPCKICFPDGKVEAEAASTDELIEAQQEAAAKVAKGAKK